MKIIIGKSNQPDITTVTLVWDDIHLHLPAHTLNLATSLEITHLIDALRLQVTEMVEKG